MKFTKILTLTLSLCFLVFFTSCEKEEQKISPADPNAIQSVLVIPGAELVTGNPPPPTGGTTSPAISSPQSFTNVTAGNSLTVPLTFNSRAGYNNCYIQVQGASNGYFSLPTNSTVNSGTINLPISVPENVGSGEFCIIICIQDAQGRVSNIVEVCIDVFESSGGGGNAGAGSANFTVGGVPYNNALCESVPSVVNNSGIDVAMITPSGTSLFLYGMPESSSGSKSFVDPTVSGFVGTFIIFTNSSNVTTQYVSRTGSVTKTASNKFSFTATLYDIITGQTVNASGSGTY